MHLTVDLSLTPVEVPDHPDEIHDKALEAFHRHKRVVPGLDMNTFVAAYSMALYDIIDEDGEPCT